MREPKRMGVGEFAKKMKVSRQAVYKWIKDAVKMQEFKDQGIRVVMIARRIVFEWDANH